MSIDLFGRQLVYEKQALGQRGIPGVGFKLTDDGQYDLENRKLCNTADATVPNDAVNLKILNRSKRKLKSDILEAVDLSYKNLDKRLTEVEKKIAFLEKNLKVYTDIERLFLDLNKKVASFENAFTQVYNKPVERIDDGTAKT